MAGVEHVPSEPVRFSRGQRLSYWKGKKRFVAEFRYMSASGKRAYIKYRAPHHPCWTDAGFVDPKNLEAE